MNTPTAAQLAEALECSQRASATFEQVARQSEEQNRILCEMLASLAPKPRNVICEITLRTQLFICGGFFAGGLILGLAYVGMVTVLRSLQR